MTRTLTVLAVALATAAGGCAAGTDLAPATLALAYTANDFSFDGPDTAPAGLTTVTLRNDGAEMHHIALVRLNDGHTMADLIAAMGAGAAWPAWAVEVGGPNAPAPGQELAATVPLEEGTYAVLCFIPSPGDGVPHIMKGMAKELTVTAGPRQLAAQTPPIELVLTDYTFAFSQPLTAGMNTIRVRTASPHRQSHEAVFAKLEPGRTAAELAAWIESPNGPPPGAPIGGTAGLSPGEWNDVTLELTPGRYAILCFIPDVGDGAPHIVHGMLTEFEIE
jgi:hypothetical protein